jgi:hypothetical protein
MDTNTAINTLQGQAQILIASANVQNQLIEAFNIAISQLQGTLTTQLQSITDEQFATLPQTIALQSQIDDLTTQVSTLSTTSSIT